MSDVTEFLLARIAEDEAVAQRVWDQYLAELPHAAADHGLHESDSQGYPSLRIGEARVLAECEAKRRIVEDRQRIDASHNDDAWSMGYSDANYAAFHALAAVYANHPDYQAAWRR